MDQGEKIDIPVAAHSVKLAGISLTGSLVFEDAEGHIVHQHGFKSPALFGEAQIGGWLAHLLQQIDSQLPPAGVSEQADA